MCPWQLLATLSSERWQGLWNCCKCENLFNENPGRQDGGIVCALCDGGVKLMVEVILTNRDNLQKKIPSPPDSAAGPLDLGLPHVPQPPKPVPGEDDRVASK